MKKIYIAALALLLMTTTAFSKVLIVVQQTDALASGAEVLGVSLSQTWQQNRMIGATMEVLRSTGADFDVVPISAMKTKWLREGKWVRNYRNTATDSTVTQYDGVIILNSTGSTGTTSITAPRPWPASQTSCYPCSMTVAPMYPTVPILFLFGATVNGTWAMAHKTVVSPAAVACSTGAASLGAGAATPGLVISNTNNIKWISAANLPSTKWNAGYVFNAQSAPSGGRRNLLSVRYLLSESEIEKGTPFNRRVLSDFDSTFTVKSDSTIIWERLLNGWGYAESPSNARLIFAHIMGVAPCFDSLDVVAGGVYSNSPCEFDETVLMFALAHLDSLTHGGLWSTSTSRLPIKAAVTIDGAFMRGPRYAAGGSEPADSTFLKNCIDSLNTLRIPYTIGVNTDSIASYPYEISWWNKLNMARFSPQSWVGVDRYASNPNFPTTVDTTSALGNGNWTSARPVDVFGRYRNRTFLGDGTGSGKDSSVYAGLLLGRQRVRAYFGNRVSGLCMAPRDDYSSKNFFDKPGAFDSLAYVLSLAGFSALRTNVQSNYASPSRFRGNKNALLGGFDRQLKYQYVMWDTSAATGSRISPIRPRSLNVLGQTGYNYTGSQFQYFVKAVNQDTATTLQPYAGFPGVSTAEMPAVTTGRFWHGFVHESFSDVDWFSRYPHLDVGGATEDWTGVFYSYDDYLNPTRHASILKLHVSDFQGDGVDPIPTRPGWWGIKSIYNSFQAINAAAGRTVFTFAWPEDIEP